MNKSILYEGISLEIWVPGCKFNCKGCHNPELQNFSLGDEFTQSQLIFNIEVQKKWIDNIVITGGDPLWSPIDTRLIIEIIKKNFPKLKIWMYTGFSKEEIDRDLLLKKIFNMCDVVITDRYVEEEKISRLDKIKKPYKIIGSYNQQIWRKENGEWRTSYKGRKTTTTN